MFSALIAGFSRHLPSQCAVCHCWPAKALCEPCIELFAQPFARCNTCALPVLPGMERCAECLRQPPVLDAALAAVSYSYPWSALVVAFKFHENTAWAKTFATLMRSAPWVEPALERADLVIPMPLSTQRLSQRGFNQTLLLADALCSAKVRAGLLLRIQDTPPQSSLPRRERLRSVQSAFAVEPRSASVLTNKRVVLVDDVMTSGASLSAAATALRQAGASHITGLVFARTES